MKYQMKKLSGAEARKVLANIVFSLSGIDPDDLTTLEKNILRDAVENPPRMTSDRAEIAILNRLD